MSVAGGVQSLSTTIAPLKHRTPTLTHAPESTHVVEQDLGGVNSVVAVVVILIELLANRAWLDTGQYKNKEALVRRKKRQLQAEECVHSEVLTAKH